MATTVIVEGRTHHVEPGAAVAQVLAGLGVDAEATVTLNARLLRGQLYASTVLADGDVLECKAAVAGSAGRPERTREIFPIRAGAASETVTEMIGAWAESVGYRLTPDKRALNAVARGLVKNAEKHGAPLCPCMPKEITGDPVRDEHIACPCVYVDNDIRAQGCCKCKLFVSPQYHETMSGVLAGMNRL